MIARVGRVDGDDGEIAQIFAVVGREREVCGDASLGDGLFGEGVRDAVLGDSDQAEGLGREWIAHDLDYLYPCTFGAPYPLGKYQLAFLGSAKIGDG